MTGLPPELQDLLAAWGALNPGALPALHGLVRDGLVDICLRRLGERVQVVVVPRDTRFEPYLLFDGAIVAIDGPSADSAIH